MIVVFPYKNVIRRTPICFAKLPCTVWYCMVLNRIAWYTCKSIVSVCRVCCQIGPTFNDYKNNSGCEAIFSKHEQRITSFPLAGRPLQRSGTFACIVQNCFSIQMVIISSLQLYYVQAPRDNLLPTGWMEGIWEADWRICRNYGHCHHHGFSLYRFDVGGK